MDLSDVIKYDDSYSAHLSFSQSTETTTNNSIDDYLYLEKSYLNLDFQSNCRLNSDLQSSQTNDERTVSFNAYNQNVNCNNAQNHAIDFGQSTSNENNFLSTSATPTFMSDFLIEKIPDFQQNDENNSEPQSEIHIDPRSEISNLKSNFMKRQCKRKKTLKVVTKKRQKREHEWIDVKAKEARANGIAGFGRKRAIVAKKLKQGCSEKCRFKCHKRISQEDRQKAFDQFWALGDKTKQWNCLNNWVVPTCSKRDDQSEDESCRKAEKISYDFILPASNNTVCVCCTMFLDTLDISYQWIRTARKKKENANSTTVICSDLRGKHSKRPFKYPDEIKDIARRHIERFPVVDSHYCRENTNRQYLEKGLSLSGMYRMYVESESADASKLVSKQMYENIFNTEFNYGFFKPKKDQCDICAGFKNMSDIEKKNNESSMNAHLRNKSTSRKLMKNDKEKAVQDSSVCSANFDLQKILTTPRTDISSMYYLSKLCVWNFTIYELGKSRGYCNLWNETIGARGSNEIASFVLQFIRLKADQGVKSFYFYTDNCAGQNKNKNIFSMYIKTCHELDISITHRFLEAGHTQSDGDSMHARIESYVRHKSVYTQMEWAKLIRECKKANKYEVEEKTQKDILNFESLADYFNWKPVKIGSVKEFYVTSKTHEIFVKYNYEDEYKKFNILKKMVPMQKICAHSLEQAYLARLPLSQRKKDDLSNMLKKKFIPQEHINDFKEVLKY